MKKLIAKIREILRNRRVRKLWTRIVSSIACLVVFVTTYALVLPAITMESQASCGIEAHQHDDSCYEERLTCNILEADGHTHTEDCYLTKQKLICDRSEHEHNSDCYDENGNLTCSLEEHQHGRECFEENRELVCGLEEAEGHHHDSSCYEKVLTCGKEAHTHSQACYREDAASAMATEGAAVASTTAGSEGGNTAADANGADRSSDAFGTLDSAQTDSEGFVPASDEANLQEPLNGNTAISNDSPAVDETRGSGNSDAGIISDDSSSAEENITEAVEETHPAVSFEDTLTVYTGSLGSDITGSLSSDTKAGNPGNDAAGSPDTDTAAGSLPASSNMTVSVSAEAGTFPAGTTMVLSAVTDMDAVAEAVEGTVDSKTRGFQAVDISFRDKDGNEIEPLKPISVTMRSDSIKAATEDSSMAPVVVHVEDRNKETAEATDSPAATVVETLPDTAESKENPETPAVANSTDAISFEADAFSVYAIVYTVDFEYEVDGKVYQFSLPGGGFVPFTDLVEVLGIIGEKNSGEGSDKNVPVTEEDTEENAAKEVVEEIDINSGTNTALTLGDVEVTDATRRFVADVASVEFSSPGLVDVSRVNENTLVGQIKENRGLECEYSADLSAEQIAEINAQTVEAGDWALIGVKPFTTEETLTITMKTGETFQVNVTDDQLRKEVLIADGNAYDVTVTYGKEAGIPEDATLEVTEFKQDSDDYMRARKAVLADKQAKGEWVDPENFGIAALDISILDKDGNKIEPVSEVRVDIKIKSLPGVDDLKSVENQISIQHHVETENGLIIDEVYSGKKDAAFDMQSNEAVKEDKSDEAVNPDDFDEENYRKELENQKHESEKEENLTNIPFMTPSFSVFTVTWRSGFYNNQVSIHYGYMENGVFHEFDKKPAPTDTSGYNNAYLIYDFDGYHYTGETYYHKTESNKPTTGGTKILPELWPVWNSMVSYTWKYATGEKYIADYYQDGSPYYKFYKYDMRNNSHIYMLYDKDETPSVGGMPNIDELSDPPSEPKILKDSVENGDGTNTLSLSIIGDTKPSKVSKLADVIVVFDVSGSMSEDMNGNETYNTAKQRLTIAKTAVSNVADKLLGPNEAGKEPRIRMALVPFSTRVQKDQVVGLTGDLTTFKNGVNSDQLTAYGATNWEEALQYANNMAVDSERATFIVFVTDGNPTVRMTRGNLTNEELEQYEETYLGADYHGIRPDDLYPDYSVFGSGATDTYNRNYKAALDVAMEITKPEANKNLYSIAISNDANKLAGFTQAANGKGNYVATNATELEQKFNDIINKMSATFGWGDIQMTDGITDLTNTVEKSGLTNVDEGTFRYWRAPAPENWRTMTDAERKAYEENLTSSNGWKEWIPGTDGKLDDGARGKAEPAKYEGGAVKWNFGENYMLEKDVIYRVTFDCWPKQEALDILSNLRNGTQFYDYASYTASNPDPRLSKAEAKAQGIIISDEEWKQIDKLGNSYRIRTNAPGAHTTYKTAIKQESHIGTSADEHEPILFQEVEPMPINSNKMKVLKEWAHGINSGHQATAVKFHLLVDGKYYMKNGSLADALTDANKGDAYVVEVGDNNNWHFDEIFIAPGIVRHGNVLETGHTYALEEFETVGDNNFNFSYEFKTQYVRPMNVDASASSGDTVKYLVEVNSDDPGTGANHVWIKDSAGAGEAGKYAASSNDGTEYYIAEGNGKGVIKATNHKTSELDITKMIVKGEGAEDKTDAQLDQETFMYRVTLEVPKGGNIDGITGYLYFKYPDGPYAPFALYGYTRPDDATTFESDVVRFDKGKVFRSWNTTNEVIKNRMLTVRDDGTQVIAMDIPQSRNEVIRFTNLPTGTRYKIQEVYANKTKPASPDNSIEGTAPGSAPGNLAEQGYTVTKIASKTSNQTDAEATVILANDTVTGTINEPDTRYYNQFTNTLGKHADVKIDVTKHLEGYEWTGEKYYFKLSAGSNTAGVATPMPLTGRNPIYVTSASGSADKTYGFDKIRFVKAGTYNYTVTEVDADGNSLAGQIVNGIRHSGVKNIVVTVTEKNNKLTAAVTGDDTTQQTAPGLVTSTTKLTNARGSVKVKKTDKNTQSLINGAVFELRKGSEKLYLQDTIVLTAAEVRKIIDISESVTLGSEEAKRKMQAVGISDTFTVGEQKLKNLMYGVNYTLHEVEPPDGYIISQNDSTFKLGIDAQGNPSVELTGDNASQSVENNEIVLSISNEPGAALPHTGGPGTRLFTILGSILILGAGALLWRRRRFI